jgi:arylsulfatase A-like enzyme
MRRQPVLSALIALAPILLLACGARDGTSAVVLIIVDTLRADHVGAYGHDRPTTPHLDRRIRQGHRFEHAYSTAPWTLPATASLYTGLYPDKHGAGYRFRELRFSSLADEVETLAERFAAEGFATAAVIANVYLSPQFGLERGFDRFVDLGGAEGQAAATADRVVDEALAWLPELGDKFFLVVHLIDPHLPYDAPAPLSGRFTRGLSSSLQPPIVKKKSITRRLGELTKADHELIAAAYHEEIAFADLHLARLFDRLEHDGVLDEGLVVLASDHGEELFDHRRFEHGHTFYQELLRVPLVFWGRGVESGSSAEVVSLVDVAPTVLEGVGSAFDGAVDGTSLWPALAGGPSPGARTVGAQWNFHGAKRSAVLKWPFKLIVGGAQRRQLFDLESDPGEKRNLAREDAARVRALKAELDALLSRHKPAKGTARTDLEVRTRNQLEALGYVD